MISQLRKNNFLNKIIRIPLRLIGNQSAIAYQKLSSKWRPSGEIQCDFEGIKFKMFNECDDGLVGYFYYNNSEYRESKDLKLFLILAQHVNTIVDIGANTGLYSILSAKVNPSCNIYSVEPYHANFKRLIRNLKINNLNVNAVNIGLGDHKGNIDFSVPDSESISDVSSANLDFPSQVYPKEKWKKISVELISLDEMALKLPPIDLIKCDVETYEMSVFRGAEKILSEQRPTILFESFLDEERKNFFNDLLQRHNYFLYLVLRDGIVRLENGFNTTDTGLNYLISPNKSTETFISFKALSANPSEILSRINL